MIASSSTPAHQALYGLSFVMFIQIWPNDNNGGTYIKMEQYGWKSVVCTYTSVRRMF